MILKAKHNILIYSFFKLYSVWIMKKHFGVIQVSGQFQDKKIPVLLISNHISWWDGFWAMYLNVKVFKRKFHFMMLEDQLRKFWFFNYSGGYSVNKKSKSVLESLNYTSELLTDSNNLILIFPQGEITTMHQQHINFENGMIRVLKNKEKYQLIFQVNLVDYFSAKKPGIYIYIEEYNNTVAGRTVQESYHVFYQKCIEKQNNIIQSK
jgi:1-acyl-sn-glycerol-3-phosphate acyltransferase